MEASGNFRSAPAGPGPGRRAAAGTLVALTLAAGALPAHAQNPIEGYDWSARTLRTSGQPIIPAF